MKLRRCKINTLTKCLLVLEKYIIIQKSLMFPRISVRELSSLAWEPEYHAVTEEVPYREI